MGAMEIVHEVIMWPAEAVDQIRKGCYSPAAAAIAVPVFMYGIPSADMEFMEIAQWYGLAGVSLVATKAALGKK